MVTEDDYRTQLREMSQSGEGMITQHDAMRQGYTYVDLSKLSLDAETISRISGETARKLNVIPVKQDGPNLWVCMEMPPDPKIVDLLSIETSSRIIPVSVMAKALNLSVSFYYPLAA